VPLALDRWQRHVIDDSRPARAIFIGGADLDGDNLADIVTGSVWYRNPGSPGGTWERRALGEPLRNMAAISDFDGDGDLDVLGTEGEGSNASSVFAWARNDGSGGLTILENLESAEGDFLQGVCVADLVPGGSMEVALSWHQAGHGIQLLSVPSDPSTEQWTWSRVSDTSFDEQLSCGDIDSDGDQDLLLGTVWLENNGGSFTARTLFDTAGSPDRNRLADIDGDGHLDAVVGYEAISTAGTLAWYEQPDTATSLWTEHVIADDVTGPMSVDVGDLDRDGDVDVVVGEHDLDSPDTARLFVFENLGAGASWGSHLVSTGDEHHDGAQLVDIDSDGDLDIISIGWGHDRVLLFENLAL